MKLLGWIVAVPVAAVVLLIVARLMLCKPDREVVKVATPMVEKIAEYIVQNGVPDSLESVPNLPYKLHSCKGETQYKTTKSTYTFFEETCVFEYENRSFDVSLSIEKLDMRIKGQLWISSNYTFVEAQIDTESNKVNIFSWFKHHGLLCSSLKQ